MVGEQLEIRGVKWLAQHPRARGWLNSERQVPLLSRLDHALLLPVRQNTEMERSQKVSNTLSPVRRWNDSRFSFRLSWRLFLMQEPGQPSLWRAESSQQTRVEHWLYRVEMEKQNNMGKKKRNPLVLGDFGLLFCKGYSYRDVLMLTQTD
jgi:hypothetical protein